ncbi:hypothetical protein [Hymenobacter sp. YC55]|uniref:hypothetical protein n=1 Tax=Hymenobacter sp. YC55 TaxID=3034019 RepID=UPI0023F6F378|nr:hypothetical protein [Hymenobacter sp. YC55]MDF7811487.1 hypothetical protein [Hymenobacter sp. YC55]
MVLTATLRRVALRLQGQSSTFYSPANQQYLLRTVSATLTALFPFYPDQLSPREHDLLCHLALLEQQLAVLPPQAHAELATWQALHRSLQAHVTAALPEPVLVAAF